MGWVCKQGRFARCCFVCQLIGQREEQACVPMIIYISLLNGEASWILHCCQGYSRDIVGCSKLKSKRVKRTFFFFFPCSFIVVQKCVFHCLLMICFLFKYGILQVMDKYIRLHDLMVLSGFICWEFTFPHQLLKQKLQCVKQPFTASENKIVWRSVNFC